MALNQTSAEEKTWLGEVKKKVSFKYKENKECNIPSFTLKDTDICSSLLLLQPYLTDFFLL